MRHQTKEYLSQVLQNMTVRGDIKKQLSITIYERENAFFKIAQIPQS